MPDSVLYAPSRERVLATNAWAFLHWGRAHWAAHSSPVAAWVSLERWRDHDPAGFRAALHGFAQLGSSEQRLCRHAGPREALVLRPADGGRMAWSRDTLRAAPMGLPPHAARSLATLHAPGQLLGPLALLLLYADLRPDDRLFVRGLPEWPWLGALLQGTTVILDRNSTGVLEAAAAEQASVVAAPAAVLTNIAGLPAAAERRLTPRIILAVGGPLAEAARRLLARAHPDTMLLACSAGRIWGDPLSPVTAAPAPRSALLAWARQ
jgi:hypothetical protein